MADKISANLLGRISAELRLIRQALSSFPYQQIVAARGLMSFSKQQNKVFRGAWAKKRPAALKLSALPC